MASSGERPYSEADLAGNKASLVKLVQRQVNKWPGPKKFQPSKAKVSDIKSALLDPTYGFTTNQPIMTSPHPPKSNTAAAGTSQSVPSTEDKVEYRALTPAPPSDASVEKLDVRIYIEDSRFIPTEKTMAILCLPLLDRICSPGFFRVLSRELISALQESNAKIDIPSTGPGIVKISFPDGEEDGWKIPFARVSHGEALQAVPFNPVALEIPDNRRFKLFVDNMLGSSSPFKDEAISPDSTVTSDAGPSGSGRSAPPQLTDPAVLYLREKLQTKDGYAAFTANRGRVLTNPAVIKDWEFVVGFTLDYDKLKTPVKVTRTTIKTALSIGDTWFGQAHTAVEIIRKHGKVAEVAAVLKEVQDPPEGSTVLFQYLKKWNDEHPM